MRGKLIPHHFLDGHDHVQYSVISARQDPGINRAPPAAVCYPSILKFLKYRQQIAADNISAQTVRALLTGKLSR